MTNHTSDGNGDADGAGNGVGMTAQPSDNTTLTEIVDGYRDNGFASDFWVEGDSIIRCANCDSTAPADRFSAHSIRRPEGASDPADMAAVVATTCPICHARGTLIVAFGPMSSPEDTAVLASIRDERGDEVLPGSASPHETPDGRTVV